MKGGIAWERKDRNLKKGMTAVKELGERVSYCKSVCRSRGGAKREGNKVQFRKLCGS